MALSRVEVGGERRREGRSRRKREREGGKERGRRWREREREGGRWREIEIEREREMDVDLTHCHHTMPTVLCIHAETKTLPLYVLNSGVQEVHIEVSSQTLGD